MIVIVFVVGCSDFFIVFLFPILLMGLSLFLKNSVIFPSFDFSLCILNIRFVFFIHCFRLLTGTFILFFGVVKPFLFRSWQASYFSQNSWMVRRSDRFSGENLSSSIFSGEVRFWQRKYHSSTWMVSIRAIVYLVHPFSVKLGLSGC